MFAFLNGIGIREHEVLVGDLSFNGRLTPQLLADVESLIILATNPIANVAGCKSRNVCRPGLVVRNRGRAWCGPRELRDGDSFIEIRS